MSDISRSINERALSALKLVANGRLQEAVTIYGELMAEAEASAPDELPELCGQYADAQERLGAVDEALVLLRRAVREALKLSEGTETQRVIVYRYFLAECLLRQNRAPEAIAVIAPGLSFSDGTDRFLLISYARCLWRTGEESEARKAAVRAVALARSDQQRQDASDALAEVLGCT